MVEPSHSIPVGSMSFWSVVVTSMILLLFRRRRRFRLVAIVTCIYQHTYNVYIHLYIYNISRSFHIVYRFLLTSFLVVSWYRSEFYLFLHWKPNNEYDVNKCDDQRQPHFFWSKSSPTDRQKKKYVCQVYR